MNIVKQRELAEQFQGLHRRESMFVLPNVWNPGSAFVFEKEGFEAVATSSAGVAYGLGFPDGEDITLEDLVGCVAQITRRINIPLSVDFERGYSHDILEIKNNARKLLAAGAVGFNIEDGKDDGTLDELSLMIDKIKILNELKVETGINFVINARTCAYWLGIGDEKARLEVAVERGNRFVEAGADCVFVPGAIDKDTVDALVIGIKGPLNIVLNSEYHDFDGLNQLGVKRLSLGSGPVRSVYNHLIVMADELKKGDIQGMLGHRFTYSKANQYFMK